MKIISATQLQSNWSAQMRCIVLSGQDSFLVQESAQQLRVWLKDSLAERRVYTMENPKSFDWDSFISTLSMPSLFSPSSLIEWIWQENCPLDKSLEPLNATLVANQNTLIIRMGPLSKTQLKSNALSALKPDLVVQHWPLEGRDLQQWLKAKALEYGLSLDSQACHWLIDHYEHRLYALAQLFRKCSFFPKQHWGIDDLVPMLDEEQAVDVFALQNALLERDRAKVVSLFKYLKTSKTELTLVVWCLHRLLLSLWSAPSQEDSFWLQSMGFWRRDAKKFWALKNAISQELARSLLRKVTSLEEPIKTGVLLESWQSLLGVSLKLCRP
jgi:DNA polymerase III subunit delta